MPDKEPGKDEGGLRRALDRASEGDKGTIQQLSFPLENVEILFVSDEVK